MIFNESIYNIHWDTKKLNELGIFSRGKSKHRPRNDFKLFKSGKYPLIQTGDIKNAILYITSHTQNYNEFGLEQSKLWDKGTLCITIAANIADTAILSYPMCFPDSVVGFSAHIKKTSEIFMHYIFVYIQKAIQNSVIGSIQDNINIDYLKKLNFKIPPKEYQDKIVSTLSSIDKKIELNNKINSELEAMAKTIYDYWFLQFEFPNEDGKPYKSSGGKMVWNKELKREIPEGWDIETLLKNRLSSFIKTGVEYFEEKNYLATANIVNEEISDGNWITYENRENRANMAPISNSVWFAKMKNSVKHLTLTNSVEWFLEKYILSTGFIGIECQENVLGYLHCFINSQYFELKKDSLAHGATQEAVNNEDLNSIKLLIPSYNILNSFNERIVPLLQRKIDNIKENQELTSLRDFLLPLLMNGQIGFKEE